MNKTSGVSCDNSLVRLSWMEIMQENDGIFSGKRKIVWNRNIIDKDGII